MIDYKKFVFAAAPYTGVYWFSQAAQLVAFENAAANIATREDAYHLFPEERNDTLRVSLVRHPCMWLTALYRSSWNVAKLKFLPEFLNLNTNQNFDDFVVEVIDTIPGAIGRLFFSYKADTYLRSEDYPDNFVELARSLEVNHQFFENPFFSNPINKYGYYESMWKTNIWNRLIASERELCEHFDYY